MAMRADDMIDRRRLRRKLTFWRVVALVIAAVGLASAAAWLLGDFGGAAVDHIAKVRIEGTITEDEEWLLSAVADQVAVALEMARLEEEVQRQRRVPDGRGESRDEQEVGRDRALATLSHDLRSPLNAIDSYAELMEMELLGPIVDRQREALGRIRMSGRHLLGVLENVLEMTRISAGVTRVRPGRVSISTVVDEAVLMISPAASA